MSAAKIHVADDGAISTCGSHFVAKAGDEKTLFELAYELEQALPWADKWAPNSVKAMGIC